MHNADLIRLHHMLDAAKEASSFAENKSRSDLKSDRMLTLSVIKAMEMIGEAASKISKECREAHPEIPWADIIAMRNRLIHVYFDIDLDVVWDTLTEDLPPLIATITEVVGTSAGGTGGTSKLSNSLDHVGD
jgi:uncharacterized protein with HEPN domain